MLDNFRKDIDKIDEQIVKLIAKRIAIVKKIGAFKKQNNLPIVDSNRFQDVLCKVKNYAIKYNISPVFIEDIYKKTHQYMCEIEKKR